MIHAYDPIYLNQAMNTLGNMLDYAVSACQQEPLPFYDLFIQSPVAGQIETGNPKYIAGMSGKELARAVAESFGDTLPAHLPLPIVERTPVYWAGWALAYIQWYFGRSFSWLQNQGLDLLAFLDAYSPLHEAGLPQLISFAEHQIAAAAHNKTSPLKFIRKHAQLTQAELAERSGVSLRMIRAYEQKQQDLSRAEVQTVFNLSRVLGCQPADLIP